jgi:hypothetical protein
MQNVKEFKAQLNQERELAMYGCSIAEYKESVESSITFQACGAAMIAMGLMSDAQELMFNDLPNAARQSLNRAKWVLTEYVIGDR